MLPVFSELSLPVTPLSSCFTSSPRGLSRALSCSFLSLSLSVCEILNSFIVTSSAFDYLFLGSPFGIREIQEKAKIFLFFFNDFGELFIFVSRFR